MRFALWLSDSGVGQSKILLHSKSDLTEQRKIRKRTNRFLVIISDDWLTTNLLFNQSHTLSRASWRRSSFAADRFEPSALRPSLTFHHERVDLLPHTRTDSRNGCGIGTFDFIKREEVLTHAAST